MRWLIYDRLMPDQQFEDERRRVLGAKVREARSLAGLTADNLARRIGARQYEITRVENGTRPPTVATVAAIARVTGVAYEQLIAPEGSPMTRKAPPSGTCTASMWKEYVSAGHVDRHLQTCDQDEGPGHLPMHTDPEDGTGWNTPEEVADWTARAFGLSPAQPAPADGG